MVDEEKQIDNIEGDNLKVEQAMTSQAADEAMNLNDVQAVETNTTATVEQNTAAAEAEYQEVLAQMTQKLESLQAQLEERTSQYMRIAADFDNFRKRNQKEKEDLEQQVKRSTITELLPVVDNFERARSQLKQQTDAELIHKSYQGIYKQLVDGLKRLGVSAMRPEGKEFDPNLHEAVMREPSDEHPEGTVLEELVRGYFLGERVLRHAMVKVAASLEGGETKADSPGLTD